MPRPPAPPPRFFHDIRVPRAQTLAKYGLSEPEWEQMAVDQGFVCGCCGKLPPAKILNIDHFHAKGWKDKKPEERKTFLRGLVCFMCNKFRLARGANPANLRGAAAYLERWMAKRVQSTA